MSKTIYTSTSGSKSSRRNCADGEWWTVEKRRSSGNRVPLPTSEPAPLTSTTPEELIEDYELMVGVLAANIRFNFREVDSRVQAIISILELIGNERSMELSSEINENWQEIATDGRWMRDCWSGPYNDDYSIDETYFHDPNVWEVWSRYLEF